MAYWQHLIVMTWACHRHCTTHSHAHIHAHTYIHMHVHVHTCHVIRTCTCTPHFASTAPNDDIFSRLSALAGPRGPAPQHPAATRTSAPGQAASAAPAAGPYSRRPAQHQQLLVPVPRAAGCWCPGWLGVLVCRWCAGGWGAPWGRVAGAGPARLHLVSPSGRADVRGAAFELIFTANLRAALLC